MEKWAPGAPEPAVRTVQWQPFSLNFPRNPAGKSPYIFPDSFIFILKITNTDMEKIFILLFLLLGTGNLYAQTDLERINETLLDYIEGTANGEPERLRNAFHPDFNLYYVVNDSLKVWAGDDYIENFEEGVKHNRIGRVVSIDYENDAATAKIEVDMPDLKRIYTDYLLLIRHEGNWEIIHKSFTYKDYPDTE